MAISNECRAKLNKQANLFNELQKFNSGIQKTLQFAQQETAADNPHAAVKDEAAFLGVHNGTIAGLADELIAKCTEIKAAFA